MLMFQAILTLQDNGISGTNIKLKEFDIELPMLDENIDSRKLAHLKKQFLSYNKLNPIAFNAENLAKSFVQFINSSVYG